MTTVGQRALSSPAARFRAGLLTSGPTSWLELALASLVLTSFGIAVFARHVANGGFYSDDWANLALYQFADSPRYLMAVDLTAEDLGSRPLLAVLLPLPHALFGGSPTAQLALALALGILTCVCCYLFLRAIPIAPLHAGAISVLALVFPWADSIRLWATASLNTVALCFAFFGAFVALRGIQSRGRRRTAALVASSALYAMSVLTYEVAGVALLLVGALYLRHAARSAALRWWAIHAAVVVAALVYTALTTAKDVGGVSKRIADIPLYTRHAVAIVSLSFVPPGTMSAAPRMGAVALVLMIIGLGILRWRRSRDVGLGFWLAFVGGSALAVASAYVITIGTGLDPIRPGTFNRGNIFAEFGMVAAVYGVAVVLAELLKPRPRLAWITATVFVGLVTAGYVARIESDIGTWDRSATIQEPVIRNALVASRAALPGNTLVSFGQPAQVDGVPIFAVMWDLDGAVRFRSDGRTRHAYPIHERARLGCGRRAITIYYLEIGYGVSASYETTYFVDGNTGRSERVASRADCLRTRARFASGPWEAPEGDGA